MAFKTSIAPFFFTWKPVNMLGGTLLAVCLLLNTLFLLFFAVKPETASAAATLLHFNLEIMIRALLLVFWPLLTYFTAYYEVFKG